MGEYRKWLKQTIRRARRQGWAVTNNGHVKFRSPDNKVVCCSASPKCQDYKMVAKDLRRAGLDLD